MTATTEGEIPRPTFLLLNSKIVCELVINKIGILFRQSRRFQESDKVLGIWEVMKRKHENRHL